MAAFRPRTQPWSKTMQRVHAMLAGELLHSVGMDPPAHLEGTPVARRMRAMVGVVVELSKPLKKGEIAPEPWKAFCRTFAMARRDLSWPADASPEEQERAWWAQIHLVASLAWSTEYMCPLWTQATPKSRAGWLILRRGLDEISDELLEAHGEEPAVAATEVSMKIWNILKRM